MASSPVAPSTPENTPRRMAVNRSFTLPPKLSSAAKPASPAAEIGAAEGIETLYVHPNANIVKFTTSTTRPTSSSPGRQEPSSSNLPWASPTERTLAAGPLEIYRVPGSVSFLHSGSLLHAIMPRSQCWCVDGVSKFAFRVLPDTYYRLELPGETEQDLAEVEKLKVTLQKVLFYERTPCPFARTFTVELPEMPEVRKKRRKSSGPAKKWRLDRAYSWKPEGWVPPEGGGEESASTTASSTDSEDEPEARSMNRGVDEHETSEELDDTVRAELADEVKELGMSTPPRARGLPSPRRVSAPSQLALQSASPSRLRTRVDVDGTVEVSEPVTSESGDGERSTRTFQAIPTDMPPSPPDSSAGLEYAGVQIQSEGGRRKEDAAVEQNPADVSEPPLTSQNVSSNDLLVAEDHRNSEDENDLDSVDVPAADLTEKMNLDHESPTHAEIEHPLHDESYTTTSEPQQQPNDSTHERPVTPPNPSSQEDPYAAIQARIQARRSIGGTTTFYPSHKSPTRQSTSSTSSTATISSNKSTVSRRSQPSQKQQAFTTAMVQKACSAFLGPPAHLVAIMLRIAARFASGAFGVDSMFYVATPIDSPRMVPGSYQIQGDGLEDEEWGEDDFGVPLRSPVRIAARGGEEGLGW